VVAAGLALLDRALPVFTQYKRISLQAGVADAETACFRHEKREPALSGLSLTPNTHLRKQAAASHTLHSLIRRRGLRQGKNAEKLDFLAAGV
jgi:hypothetical protein